MVSVADDFGIELSTAARAGVRKAGFKLAYDKSYPIGTQDLAAADQRGARQPAPTPSSPSAIRPTRSALTEQPRSRSASTRRSSIPASAPPSRSTSSSSAPTSTASSASAAVERRRPSIKDYCQAPQGSDRTARARPLGAARSPTPACRSCSRRSSGSARSTAPRSSRRSRPARSTPSIGKIKLDDNVDTSVLVGRPVAGRRILRPRARRRMRGRASSRSCRSRRGRLPVSDRAAAAHRRRVARMP